MKATTFAGPALLAAIVVSISAALLFAQVPTLQPAEPDQPTTATPTAPPIAPAPTLPARPRAVVGPVQAIQTLPAPALVRDSKPPVQLKIYKLKYADAGSLASVISQSIDAKGPMKVVPDSRTNQLVISASQPDSEILESLIQQLDVPSEEAKPGLDPTRSSGRRSATGGTSSSAGSDTIPRAVGGAVGGGGRGGFSAGGFGGGASFNSGGGFQGAFGAAGEGGGFGSSGFAPKAATAVDSAELTKALREADATAKQTDAQAKEMAAVLKQIESMTNKTDESAKLYAHLRELLEHQRQASEQQRRAVENASRAAEAAGRNAASIYKLEPDAARPNLFTLKMRLDTGLAQVAQLQDSLKEAEASGRTAEAEHFRALIQKSQANVAAITAQLQNSGERPKKVSEADGQLNKQLAEYKKLLSGKLSDEQKAKAAELKEQLKAMLDKQFEESQTSHSDELRQMRERLEKLEKEMSDRTKNRSEIINRRLDELLAAKDSGKLNVILALPEGESRKIIRMENGDLSIEGQHNFVVGKDARLEVIGGELPITELKVPQLDSNDDPFGNPGLDAPKPAPNDDPFR